MKNLAILIGRITKDIEVRKSPSNKSVVSFSLAIDSGKKDAEPDYINCVAWNQSADFLGQHAGKGDLVYCEGKIKTRTYEKNDIKYYVTEVVCSEVELLSKKRSSEVKEQPVNQQMSLTGDNTDVTGFALNEDDDFSDRKLY